MNGAAAAGGRGLENEEDAAAKHRQADNFNIYSHHVGRLKYSHSPHCISGIHPRPPCAELDPPAEWEPGTCP